MATKKEMLAAEIAKAVGAGKAVALPTVDFSDPSRSKTCLEVDFPILRINELAAIEASSGATKKPIYQLSKWWARRQPSVFRSMLVAAATKAPADPSQAAKLVWDNYYANHQKKGAFKHLKVADIFMGGGTTLVEGSRLGMQMIGNDLNPVAWFVCKQELAQVDLDDVKRLLADIEADVKPQIMPYYYCDGPNGEKGKWTHLPTEKVMSLEFDPLTIPWSERKNFKYEGPEVIYTFWTKHGQCQVTGCGHRTPIMSGPVVARKILTVRHWEIHCRRCGTLYHTEETSARIAPVAPLFVASTEIAHSTLDKKNGSQCPQCGYLERISLGKASTKKVELTLLTHPQWRDGSSCQDVDGNQFGGSARDNSQSTARWNRERASRIRLLEVRGALPAEVECPVTGVKFGTTQSQGTVPQQGHFACSACGTVRDQASSFKRTGKTGPIAGVVVQCFSPQDKEKGSAYNGRFFLPFENSMARQYNASIEEWELRRETDLAPYWPKDSLIPLGHEAHQRRPLDQHGYLYWSDFFNPRQLLVQSLLLKAILTVGSHSWTVREYVLAGFQQYLRNNNSFCFWNIQADQMEPQFSNNNFHPKVQPIENNVFGAMGRGNWVSCAESLAESWVWGREPWETVSGSYLQNAQASRGSVLVVGKSGKVWPGDSVGNATVFQCSSTDLSSIEPQTLDLIVTDPPFGDLIQYSELSDFFYVWLRIGLLQKYPSAFGSDYTPKTLEAVSNRYREPEDPNGYYQRILTACWHEAHRVLKPSGILAFTFHHSEDEPWVAVLESLFNAGFYLEATYPIRSDETKGDRAQFGAQKIEYDIIHVCRKRTEEPSPVSWGRMRREVLADVHQLQGLLENHAKEGLPAADLQVIRRGKALEYFSRHYGKVYVDEGRTMGVKEALAGINQLIDEDAQQVKDPPPVIAEPITRQFLRIFEGKSEVARDQMQKFLRGSGLAPDEFVQRGWCTEKNKVFTLVPPLEFAKGWVGKHKHKLTYDLDQALVLIGACFENSGIQASDTLKSESFRPHVALKPLLQWFEKRSGASEIRFAARKAITLCNNSPLFRTQTKEQLELFGDEATA